MIYNEIHGLKGQGFSNSQIARKLRISRNRVIDYGKMKPEEFFEFVSSLQNSSKKLVPYHETIVGWLKEHPDLSGAQVLDWLEERLSVTSVSENTVRNYVNDIRETYHIPKQIPERDFGAVPELPMGQQMQVDFGEMKVPTTAGSFEKLYFVRVRSLPFPV
jgi:transposase